MTSSTVRPAIAGGPAQSLRAIAAPRPARRVRTQWLALGAAFVVLAGVLVAWAVGAASRRVQVVQVVQAVPAGTPLQMSDLALTAVAFEPGVDGLVPEASIDALVGRLAAIDLRPGVLLQRGMWRDGIPLLAGERGVGAVLVPGRFPAGLGAGDLVIGASLSASDSPSTDSPLVAEGVVIEQPDTPETTSVVMRVLDLVSLESGSTSFTLAVPETRAVWVAQLAATDQLVVLSMTWGSDALDEPGAAP